MNKLLLIYKFFGVCKKVAQQNIKVIIVIYIIIYFIFCSFSMRSFFQQIGLHYQYEQTIKLNVNIS